MFARAPHHLLSVMLIALLSACGGGGGSSSPEPSPGTGGTGGTGGTASISCTAGSGYQCSGDSNVRIDNGIALTAAGVQAYGVSTSDLASPNLDSGHAYGLQAATGGSAEIRLKKATDGSVSSIAILLDKLGISWDGSTDHDRPQIIETFRTTQGRMVKNASGDISAVALPPHTDLDFFDHATEGSAATQENYANNVYFPRPDIPPRCDLGQTCSGIETEGVKNQVGNWRTVGNVPDRSYAARLHSDGDLCAGDGPTVKGTVTYFSGCNNGPGSAYAGFKGYRSFENFGYQYGNIAQWVTQDTVNIVEFAGAGDEHNKVRRGIVAFGDITPPAALPTSGTAGYTGVVYGWYANGATETASNDAKYFTGVATVTLNFATGNVQLSISGAQTFDEAGTPVPANFTISTSASSPANYFTSVASNGTLQGGVSGRYFGPSTGGTGPAEVGGAFTLSGTIGQTAIGGFIARKQ